MKFIFPKISIINRLKFNKIRKYYNAKKYSYNNKKRNKNMSEYNEQKAYLF